MRRKHPAPARMWPVGTTVDVVRDDGEVQRTKTRSEPWQLGSGDWVVMVEGIAGGYSVERVREAGLEKDIPVPLLTADELRAWFIEEVERRAGASREEMLNYCGKRDRNVPMPGDIAAIVTGWLSSILVGKP